jgi:uncharacterized phage infection (PIP) family protein YhgE
MTIKVLISVIVFITILSSNISASANILDDIKGSFGQNKNKVNDKITQIKNNAQTEQDGVSNEDKKICEIQKGYATKHFENRQRDRSKDIEDKTTKINKIKQLLSNNKQDVEGLNATIENLIKLLKQKTELLNLRTKDASSIDCTYDEKSTNARSTLQSLNEKLAKLDKDIRTQTREFSTEVQRLILKMKEPKVEEVK